MKSPIFALCLLGTLASAQSLSWQLSAPSGGHHGAPAYHLDGFAPTTQITYIDPQLNTHELNATHPHVTLPKSAFGSYHVLVAQNDTPALYASALTYIYGHGKPSDRSPRLLTEYPKAQFEITPDPLPREHDRYTASKKYRFVVTCKGKPVAAKVHLQTQNGTRETFESDAYGVVELTLPNDFKAVTTGRRANAPASFTLGASLVQEGRTYETTLSAHYHVNPTDYWQSEPYGAAVALLGFGLGVLAMRRKTNG
ncbi:MAG: hypothetical protein JXK05_12910 [Campylobacterales bacterium]|nr:hypothetical protein [Campylobacterales bacterium]